MTFVSWCRGSALYLEDDSIYKQHDPDLNNVLYLEDDSLYKQHDSDLNNKNDPVFYLK